MHGSIRGTYDLNTHTIFLAFASFEIQNDLPSIEAQSEQLMTHNLWVVGWIPTLRMPYYQRVVRH